MARRSTMAHLSAESDPTNAMTNIGTDAIRISDAASAHWDDAGDMVVVGYGGAGIAAALHGLEGGADVIAIDRFDGGGATAYSGGVVYAGSTAVQREAGIEDNADDMARYLALEIGDMVTPETIRRYCLQSADNIEWMQSHGVRFGAELYTGKTTYPPEGKFLYFSGNEKVETSVAVAKPAPRGHRTRGTGFTGRFLYAALRQAADGLGVRVRRHAWVRRLVVDASDRVVGVEAIELPEAHHAEHQKLYDAISPMVPFKEVKAERANEAARDIERKHGVVRLIRARRGVVLSTGGYVYNLSMLREHAPLLGQHYASLLRMGSLGDDGSADRLGKTVGARSERLDNMFIGRVLSPPAAFLDGVLVNAHARRFVNEAIYLGSLGKAIVEQPHGKAWLILPRASFRRAYAQITTGGWASMKLFGGPALLNMMFGGTRKASNLRALARKCGLDEAVLSDTIAHYNVMAAARHDDDFAKLGDYLAPIKDGPCVALNVSLENRYSFMQTFSLGGLPVDEATGAVTRPDGSHVAGLYAAGRAAIGLPSNRYISGLSLADCIFSGRRAAQTCLLNNQPAGS